jgi:hypothetical protein
MAGGARILAYNTGILYHNVSYMIIGIVSILSWLEYGEGSCSGTGDTNEIFQT